MHSHHIRLKTDCCPLLSIIIHCCLLSSIVVHCCPLLFISLGPKKIGFGLAPSEGSCRLVLGTPKFVLSNLQTHKRYIASHFNFGLFYTLKTGQNMQKISFGHNSCRNMLQPKMQLSSANWMVVTCSYKILWPKMFLEYKKAQNCNQWPCVIYGPIMLIFFVSSGHSFAPVIRPTKQNLKKKSFLGHFNVQTSPGGFRQCPKVRILFFYWKPSLSVLASMGFKPRCKS